MLGTVQAYGGGRTLGAQACGKVSPLILLLRSICCAHGLPFVKDTRAASGVKIPRAVLGCYASLVRGCAELTAPVSLRGTEVRRVDAPPAVNSRMSTEESPRTLTTIPA